MKAHVTYTWLQSAKKGNKPRVLTIQNEYSLLCRLFDLDLAERLNKNKLIFLHFPLWQLSLSENMGTKHP